MVEVALADTAEEMRQEFGKWLDYHVRRLSSTTVMNYGKKADRVAAAARLAAYEEIRDFVRDVPIESRKAHRKRAKPAFATASIEGAEQEK